MSSTTTPTYHQNHYHIHRLPYTVVDHHARTPRPGTSRQAHHGHKPLSHSLNTTSLTTRPSSTITAIDRHAQSSTTMPAHRPSPPVRRDSPTSVQTSPRRRPPPAWLSAVPRPTGGSRQRQVRCRSQRDDGRNHRRRRSEAAPTTDRDSHSRTPCLPQSQTTGSAIQNEADRRRRPWKGHVRDVGKVMAGSTGAQSNKRLSL